MILSLSLLRVEDRELDVVADLGTSDEEWKVQARLQNPEDLRYLAGLFATSSEPAILEFDVMEDGLLKRYRGKAHIIGVPQDSTETIHFQGVGRLEQLSNEEGS